MISALQPLIGTAADRPLTRTEAETAFGVLFNGEATASQMGGFLMACVHAVKPWMNMPLQLQ